MNTYYFLYVAKLPNGEKECSHVVKARRLSQALKSFRLDSEKFSFPVLRILPCYNVVNSLGKMSIRILPPARFFEVQNEI